MKKPIASNPQQQEADDATLARQFRLLLESTSEGIYGIDTQGRCTFINQAAARMLGYQPDEVLGRNMHHLIHHTHTDGSPYPEGECPIFQAFKTAEHVRIENGILWRKNGTSFRAEYASSPIVEEDEVHGAVVMFSDITEQKRLLEEAQCRATQQQALAALGLFALETHDLSTLMNHATCLVHETLEVDYSKILELLPEGDALLLKTGIGWRDGLVGKATVGTDLDSQAGYTLKEDEPVIVADLRTESRFRGPTLLREHGVVSGMSVIIKAPGSPYGVFGVHTKTPRTFTQHDTHFLQAVANILGEAVRRARTEAELQQARGQLEEQVEQRTRALKSLNQELEAFNYSVSHDLRAPVRGIAGFSQALLEDYGESLHEGAKHYLARIQTGTKRMGTLIDALLSLSRFSRETLTPRPISLAHLAQEIAERLQEQDPQREVAFRITEGVKAEADPRLMMVVLENLFGNAWKFTRERHPALIEFGTLSQGDQMVYYVTDNGAGFDMAYANKLFTPFQRLHTTAEFEGTGIGLATVQRIIHRHGGKIWAEGEEGKGAIFYFTLNTN